MTLDQQRIALAEWDGWTRIEDPDAPGEFVWHLEGRFESQADAPAYDSLDEMHRLEEKLFASGMTDTLNLNYWNTLWEVCGDEFHTLTTIAHAKVAQRREALLKTLGLWKEAK